MKLSPALFNEAILCPDSYEFQPPDTIKVTGDLVRRCAWCDDERGVHYVGNVTHTICLAHLASNLADSRGKDDPDTLYWSVLAAIASQAN
jgi:hypothetical protein